MRRFCRNIASFFVDFSVSAFAHFLVRFEDFGQFSNGIPISLVEFLYPGLMSCLVGGGAPSHGEENKKTLQWMHGLIFYMKTKTLI